MCGVRERLCGLCLRLLAFARRVNGCCLRRRADLLLLCRVKVRCAGVDGSFRVVGACSFLSALRGSARGVGLLPRLFLRLRFLSCLLLVLHVLVSVLLELVAPFLADGVAVFLRVAEFAVGVEHALNGVGVVHVRAVAPVVDEVRNHLASFGVVAVDVKGGLLVQEVRAGAGTVATADVRDVARLAENFLRVCLRLAGADLSLAAVVGFERLAPVAVMVVFLLEQTRRAADGLVRVTRVDAHRFCRTGHELRDADGSCLAVRRVHVVAGFDVKQRGKEVGRHAVRVRGLLNPCVNLLVAGGKREAAARACACIAERRRTPVFVIREMDMQSRCMLGWMRIFVEWREAELLPALHEPFTLTILVRFETTACDVEGLPAIVP